MNDLKIQYLDSTSGWLDCHRIDEGVNMNPATVNHIVKDIQRMYPGKKLRSVDTNDRLIDIYN